MVSMERIERGISMYMDREMLPEIPLDSGKKILFGIGSGVVLKGYMRQFEALKDNEIAVGSGMIDKDGNVDIDMLRREILSKMPDDGMGFDINMPLIGHMNLKLHRADIDRIYSYIVG